MRGFGVWVVVWWLLLQQQLVGTFGVLLFLMMIIVLICHLVKHEVTSVHESLNEASAMDSVESAAAPAQRLSALIASFYQIERDIRSPSLPFVVPRQQSERSPCRLRLSYIFLATLVCFESFPRFAHHRRSIFR